MKARRMKAKSVGAVAVAAALWSCSEEGPHIDVEAAIPVRVERVTRRPIAEYVTATGTARARREGELVALQAGLYEPQRNPRTGRSFAMGDAVREGEVVVRLDNAELVNQVGLDSKKLAFTSAQREYDKQQALYEKGGITLRELIEAERALIDARYALESVHLQLAKLEVRVAFDGTLVDLAHYSPHQRLEAGADIGQVMAYDRLYTEVLLPGQELARVHPGQAVVVTHYGAAETDTLGGTVAQVSPVLDQESRMFKAAVTIDNDSLSIRPGMFVKVEIVAASRDSALVIPRDVVLDRGDSKAVFVVEKGIAVERRLETGLSNREEMEVLGGLDVDDRLVVEGFETLRNRSKVRVTMDAADRDG